MLALSVILRLPKVDPSKEGRVEVRWLLLRMPPRADVDTKVDAFLDKHLRKPGKS